MRRPLIALVGRPNVGKSTLFNRLTRSRDAVVIDQPGVTRDRMYGQIDVGEHEFLLVDTGGLDFEDDTDIVAQTRAQVEIAVAEADLVILVVDGRQGLIPADHDVAQFLRSQSTDAIVVMNKLDDVKHDEMGAEGYALGFERVVGMSAEHGRGQIELESAVLERLPNAPKVPSEEAEEEASKKERGPTRIAIVGKPNVGKSSLLNAIVGDERAVASPIAGTTVDPVDTHLQYEGKDYVLVDTAGIRKRGKVNAHLEKIAVLKAIRALERADVALVVVDATENELGEQDARLLGMVNEAGVGVVLVINKWDVATDEQKERVEAELDRRFGFVTHHAPVRRVSAKTGRGVGRLLGEASRIADERGKRISTGELNRFFEMVRMNHPPRMVRGRRPRLYYVTQPHTHPPTFVFVVSHPDTISGSYVRYLRNALRERYGFEGTPLWIKLRKR